MILKGLISSKCFKVKNNYHIKNKNLLKQLFGSSKKDINIVNSEKINLQKLFSPLNKKLTFQIHAQKPSVQKIPSLKQFIKNDKQQQNATQQTHQNDLVSNINTTMASYEILSNVNQQIYPKQQQLQQTKFEPLKYHIQTYGCQMNVNDTEIVRSILSSATSLFRPQQTLTPQQANVVFLNTCAIRQSAQHKIHQRLKQLRKQKNIKILGLLGCMAERLKDKMFNQGVNIICGPDAYRDLPKLVEASLQKNFTSNQMNIQLSVEQTYADITPIRKNMSTISSFLSIMRGCNNMCSFCIVPFVRGRQRSRSVDTILQQISQLQKQGVKQITFLGQNVNSYHDISKQQSSSTHKNSQGFSQMFKLRQIPGIRFDQLLQISAKSFPDLRFRFTSPHPKDFPDEVLQKISSYHNICKYIHLPAQSGNTEMLFKMRRNHTREAYLNLVQKMKSMIPTLTLSTDLICGFCGQTEEQFQDTLSLIQQVKYQTAFLFAYSMRQKTHAHRNFVDDVPEHIKKQRLKRMIDLWTQVQRPLNDKQINKIHLLLVENTSKKDTNKWIGKTDNFKKGIIQKSKIPFFKNGSFEGQKDIQLGDYVAVKVKTVGPRSLNCQPIAIVSKLSQFTKFNQKIVQNHQ